MKIEFVGKKISFLFKREIKKAVSLSLKSLNQKLEGVELSINFVSKEEMKELNNRTRNIDKVTDVLSYPNYDIKPYEIIDEEFIYLGDMAICLEKAKEQALEFGNTLKQEVIKLVIHSILHLMGFDHIKDEDYEVMHQEEEKIASIFYTNKKI